MQEVFSKIIERFKSEVNYNDGAETGLKQSIEIVKQEAEKYDNGWISCSERFPEESLNDVIGWDAYRERCCFVHYIGGRFILGDDTESVKITHWMPTPYQPKGE